MAIEFEDICSIMRYCALNKNRSYTVEFTNMYNSLSEEDAAEMLSYIGYIVIHYDSKTDWKNGRKLFKRARKVRPKIPLINHALNAEHFVNVG